MKYKYGDFNHYPVHEIKQFEVDPNNWFDRLWFGREFFEALENDLQDCRSLGACQ